MIRGTVRACFMSESLADAVIVGGGILGMSLAYELAKRTMRVTLLESHALGSGATGSGFAWINATSKDEDAAYHRLNAAGVAAYDALAQEWGAEALGLHGGGSLQWVNGDDEAGRKKLLHRADVLQSWMYPVVLLSGREMRTLEPGIDFAEDALGLFAPPDRWLDAPRYIRFLANETQKRKGLIRQYSPALKFTLGITRSINMVHTIDGPISTPLLIIAAGLQIPALLEKITGAPEAAKQVPLRADAGLLIETPPGSAPDAIHRVLYPPDSDGLHLRPTPGSGLLFGSDDGDREVQSPADAQNPAESRSGENIPKDISAALYHRVQRVLPRLAFNGAAPYSPRVCLRPMPADERPLIGSIPGVRGVFVLAAHSGATLAPALARALAEEICNARLPEELLPYRPERFLKFSDE